MLRHVRFVWMVVGCALASASGAAAGPFINGSFEDSTLPSIGVWTNLPEGSHMLPGWRIAMRGVDHIGTYWQAADGSRSIDLNGENFGGIIEQDFDTPSVVLEARVARLDGPSTRLSRSASA